jgi:Abortive infection alpha
VGDGERESGLGLAERERSGALEAAPGLARIGAEVWWRTARWSVETSLRFGGRLARAAVSPERASELIDDTAAELRSGAQRLLGLVDSEGRAPSLRERGEDLLRASADVHYEQGTHPAYERILADLAPDEARILRLLAQEGPQPSIDVRAGLAFVPGSRLVMQGHSMIGAEAGCRFGDQVPAYLSNLHRLGLIWFSRDPVRDRERYQVIEVQPEVMAALREAGRFSHVVRRSIHLTPLGRNFCSVSLPLEKAEFEALDQHQFPDEA